MYKEVLSFGRVDQAHENPHKPNGAQEKRPKKEEPVRKEAGGFPARRPHCNADTEWHAGRADADRIRHARKADISTACAYLYTSSRLCFCQHWIPDAERGQPAGPTGCSNPAGASAVVPAAANGTAATTATTATATAAAAATAICYFTWKAEKTSPGISTAVATADVVATVCSGCYKIVQRQCRPGNSARGGQEAVQIQVKRLGVELLHAEGTKLRVLSSAIGTILENKLDELVAVFGLICQLLFIHHAFVLF